MTSRTSTLAPPYHVQSTAATSRSGFPYFSHHDSVSALWTQRWRPLCSRGLYPFAGGAAEDLDPVFAELVAASGDDPALLHRPEEYAAPFLPRGEELVVAAQAAEQDGDLPGALGLYLRAAVVFRIARYPINRSPLTQHAWRRGKAAYESAARYLDPPSTGVEIPFAAADLAAGDADAPVPASLRVPTGQRPRRGWPVLLFVCGLDGYRTDQGDLTQVHVDRGFAVLSFEVPGTGDCPAAPGDPGSADRLMTSVLAWVASDGAQHDLDAEHVVARGVSTGGHYAMRLAHTHAEQLVAVVAQGGGAHHMFDPGWIRAQNQMEYPFALADALAHKFGFRDPDPAAAVEAYASGGRAFSLLESGVLDRTSTRLLVINGREDSVFPSEDSVLVATAGRHKDLVLRADRGHMGEPGSSPVLHAWLDEARAGWS